MLVEFEDGRRLAVAAGRDPDDRFDGAYDDDRSEAGELVRRDPRYAYEAYEFVFHGPGVHASRAAAMSRRAEGERRRTPCQRAGAARGRPRAGPARVRPDGRRSSLWGINRTDDFGEIVFNLVEAELMSKTDEERLEDFHDVFDFDKARRYRIQLDECGEIAVGRQASCDCLLFRGKWTHRTETASREFEC